MGLRYFFHFAALSLLLFLQIPSLSLADEPLTSNARPLQPQVTSEIAGIASPAVLVLPSGDTLHIHWGDTSFYVPSSSGRALRYARVKLYLHLDNSSRSASLNRQQYLRTPDGITYRILYESSDTTSAIVTEEGEIVCRAEGSPTISVSVGPYRLVLPLAVHSLPFGIPGTSIDLIDAFGLPDVKRTTFAGKLWEYGALPGASFLLSHNSEEVRDIRYASWQGLARQEHGIRDLLNRFLPGRDR